MLCPQELIQNADDAQATEVVFIHDDRSYGTESLWTQELGQYQGTSENGNDYVKSTGYSHNNSPRILWLSRYEMFCMSLRVLAQVPLSMSITMHRLPKKTGREFSWQEGVSNETTRTKSGGLGSASTLFTT